MAITDITAYFHCRNCGSGKLAVGFTEYGVQAYCEACELNVIRLELDVENVKVLQFAEDPQFPEQVRGSHTQLLAASHESNETALLELVLPIDSELPPQDYESTVREAKRAIGRSPLLTQFFSNPRMVGTGDRNPNGKEYQSLHIEFLAKSAENYDATDLATAFVQLLNSFEHDTNYIWAEFSDAYIAHNGVSIAEAGDFIRDLRGNDK